MLNKIFLCAFLCCYNFYCGAIEVLPSIYEFEPGDTTSNGNIIQYSIKNLSDKPFALEVTILRREIGVDGGETLIPDEDSFCVYPSQIIIPANGSRSIKVSWIGNDAFKKDPRREQAFRVRFSQYSLETNKRSRKQKGPAVEVRLEVLTSLYMVPAKACAAVSLVSTKATTINGENAYIVQLKNNGTKHLAAKNADVKLNLFGKEGNFGDFVDDVCPVLAGHTRAFIITNKKP
ncbi:MAG: hypothetical protein LBJ19_01485 [Holosporaceae bacterium]|jgi:P pilus assembly chaperone PapD|nr:hypothetical protein [Holosporaceae bacterium]